jgi:hypothetical protein
MVFENPLLWPLAVFGNLFVIALAAFGKINILMSQGL